MIAPALLLPAMVGMLLGISPGPAGFSGQFPQRAEQAGGAVRFRRVLVPEERMKDWPTGAERYLPMDAAEFERLAGILSRREKDQPALPAAAIASARFSARLEGDRLIGTAVLDVVLSGSGPVALPLEPCSAALGDARWLSPPETPVPAVLGLTDEGRLAALAERPGRLEFEWTLVARRDVGGAARFAFETPAAAAKVLLLDLPDDLAPSIDRGLVLGSEPSERGRLWRIELPRAGRVNIHVVRANAEAGRPLAILRESLTYDCSPRGLDVSVQWKLQSHNGPLDRLTALLDPGLRLVSATLGDSPVPWSAVAADDGGPVKIELRLPEPVRGAERTVRLSAIGPAVLERKWRLPRIRCEGPLWQEGAIALLASEPLAAERIEPVGCVQTGAGPLSAPRTGTSAQFQCFDPEATVEVLLAAVPSGRTRTTPKAAGPAAGQSADKVENQAESGVTYQQSGPIAGPSHEAAKQSSKSGAAAPERPQGATAWAWELRLESWFQRGAGARHLAVYELQNAGRRRMELALPPGVGRDNIRGVWIAGKPAAWEVQRRDRRLAVPLALPAGLEQVRVSVEWTTAGPGLGIAGSLNADPPVPDLPVLARNWTVRLPPGYESADRRAWKPAETEGRGWTAWRMDFSDTSPPTLRYVNRHSARLLGVIMFVLFAAVGLIGRRPVHFSPASTSGNMPLNRCDTPGVNSEANSLLKMGATAGLSSSAGRNSRYFTAGQASSGTQTFHSRLFQRAAKREFPQNSATSSGIRSGICLPLTLLGLFAAAAALAPGALLPAAWGGAMGSVFWLAWRFVSRPLDECPRPKRRSRRPHSDSTVSGVTALGLLAAAVLSAGLLGRTALLPAATVGTGAEAPNGPFNKTASVSLGATAGLSSSEIYPGTAGQASSGTLSKRPENAAAGGGPIFNVFVPVDAQRKPVGEKVYVPERFYRELHLRAGMIGKPPAWMIRKAVYRCELGRESASGRLTAGNIRAQYDLYVFEAAAAVRLPLRGEGASLPAGGALLDGRPIEPRWEPETASLAFEIAEPGEYRLELSLRPTMINNGFFGGFEASIPRVPSARLELTSPDGASAVEIPSARGGVWNGEGERQLRADLGPADSLSVRWEQGVSPDGAGRAAEVEQLTWLKIQPGSVQATLKLKFHAVEGGIQQVRLAVDPRLRLLPPSGEGSPVAHVVAESATARQIVFRWPRPLAGDATLEAALVLGGASGVGNVPWPKIELLDFKPARNWSAFSVDPALDYDQLPGEPLEQVAVDDFLDAWGKSDSAPPQAAFRPVEGGGWALSTRPHQPRGRIEQCLSLFFDADRADVLFEAAISISSGYVFQHRLTAPRELKVEGISVLEGDLERVERWSRHDDGTITVFLAGPASGKQDMVLRGWMPISLGRELPLPAMRVQTCDLSTAAVRLYRRPRVLLEVRDLPAADGARTEGERIGPTPRRPELGRLDRTIHWDGSGSPPAAVVLRPNRPKIAAEQLVRPIDDDRRWTARAEFRLKVEGGLADEVRIRAPAPWNGPFEIDRPGELQVRDEPGMGRSLVFRPREAISSDYTFTVSGPLELAPGERPAVPDVSLADIDDLKRRIVLPVKNGDRTYRWRTSGLKRLGSDAPGANIAAETCCYEASGERWQASLESLAVSGVVGSVRLAEVALAWQSDGRLRGAAALLVEPDGVAERILRLPDGCELAGATVAGAAIRARRVGDGLWRLSLPSADAPQSLELVYRGLLPQADWNGRIVFAAPKLEEMPVRRTCWTVNPPAGWTVSGPQGAAAAEAWAPAGVLGRIAAGQQQSARQYEPADGGARLSLVCRPAGRWAAPRYLAGAVALGAFGLLGIVLLRRGKK